MTTPTNAELLVCYRSGQMSEAEWQEWVRERPELQVASLQLKQPG